MGAAHPQFWPGYLLHIPYAHVAAAGGLAGVYENFASRARAYFRTCNPSFKIQLSPHFLYVHTAAGLREDWPRLVTLAFSERLRRADTVCVGLSAVWPSPWE